MWYIHVGILFSAKKEKVLTFAAMWMNLKYITLRESEARQSQKANTTLSHVHIEY
jgi:hypothetical protein